MELGENFKNLCKLQNVCFHLNSDKQEGISPLFQKSNFSKVQLHTPSPTYVTYTIKILCPKVHPLLRKLTSNVRRQFQ